ncbi:MAG: urease accessory protein UreD [Armatimonadetes bacterium]|nr:urease accessory protein UreD [Akkermansiaceae bacterium]
MEELTGNSVSGHLRLRCEVREDGVPFLAEQSFRAPVHLSKPHVDAGCLVVSVVNPTAGFFDGDSLVSEVEVCSGAKLVMSTPAASRVFRTRSGKAAVNRQKFSVAAGGFFEWIPEAFIPHAGANYEQRTEIELEAGAGLLFVDWISPGRVARGEVFEYERLRWELDLKVDGRLMARERYEMRGAGDGLEGIKAMFEAGHYVSVYVAGRMIDAWPGAELDKLGGEDVYMGHGRLEGSVMVLRALCRDSLAARGLVEKSRALLYGNAGMTVPNLGRIFM